MRYDDSQTHTGGSWDKIYLHPWSSLNGPRLVAISQHNQMHSVAFYDKLKCVHACVSVFVLGGGSPLRSLEEKNVTEMKLDF